jgi:hypothetical protein
MDDWRESASMSVNDRGLFLDEILSSVSWNGSECEDTDADSVTQLRLSVLRSARDCVRNPRRLGSVSSAYLSSCPRIASPYSQDSRTT